MNCVQLTGDGVASASFNVDYLSHAYIVVGTEEKDRNGLADRLAAAIVCRADGLRPCMCCPDCRKAMRGVHPDIIYVKREDGRREFTVDRMRGLKKDAVILPNEAAKKVYVIREADTMNAMAQNAMLKLLEEPPDHTAFVLTAENISLLLPTVRSRCVTLSVTSMPADDDMPQAEMAVTFLDILAHQDNLRLIEFSFALEKLGKDGLNQFIQAASAKTAEALRQAVSAGEKSISPKILLRVMELLARVSAYLEANVNPGHAVGMLCAELMDWK
jgi:DNA polymerase-3 subunit delta'